jgi:hypothetical protein
LRKKLLGVQSGGLVLSVNEERHPKFDTIQRAFDGWWPRWAAHIGSDWPDPDGDVKVPYLDENDRKRNLNLNIREREWRDNWLFAAVPQLAVRLALSAGLLIFYQLLLPTPKLSTNFIPLL